MRRIGRLLLFFALFLLLGVLCVAGYMWWQGKQAPPPPPAAGGEAVQEAPRGQAQVPTVEVVVAGQPIRRGQRITEDMLQLVPFPADRVLESYILNMDDAVGKIAMRDLPQGIILTKGDLVASAADLLGKAGSVISAQIPPGYVAISIPISRLTSVSYAIQPGDQVGILVTLAFVDIDEEFQSILPNISGNVISNAVVVSGAEGGASLLTGEGVITNVQQTVAGGNSPVGRLEPTEDFTFYVLPSEPQRPRFVTQMIIPSAWVLFVGEAPWYDQAAAPQGGTPAEGEAPPAEAAPAGQPQAQQAQPGQQTPTRPEVATLMVKPQDAVTIKYLLDRKVVLTLVLRGTDDQQDLQTDAVTLRYLLDNYNLVVPAKVPYDLQPRVDAIYWPEKQYYDSTGPVEFQPQP
ncbi:MAG: Flp pilus assembly protein CpaB [Chloroflexi bacterium]|nr:Flp pilus assembly protein CpaB [Chloroflexota bacterium]